MLSEKRERFRLSASRIPGLESRGSERMHGELLGVAQES